MDLTVHKVDSHSKLHNNTINHKPNEQSKQKKIKKEKKKNQHWVPKCKLKLHPFSVPIELGIKTSDFSESKKLESGSKHHNEQKAKQIEYNKRVSKWRSAVETTETKHSQSKQPESKSDYNEAIDCVPRERGWWKRADHVIESPKFSQQISAPCPGEVFCGMLWTRCDRLIEDELALWGPNCQSTPKPKSDYLHNFTTSLCIFTFCPIITHSITRCAYALLEVSFYGPKLFC